MRVFIAAIILIFSFQSWTRADDISDFQIEGISVGDSLLDYFEEEEIKDNIDPTSFKDKKYSKFEIFEHYFLKTYNSVQIFFKSNDKRYTIYFVSGGLFDENIEIKNCKKKNEIAKEISKSFKDVKIDDIGIYSHRIDKKSKVNAIYFFFKSGGYVKVACVDYSKEIEDKWGWSDNVRVDISTEEFSDWLSNASHE